MQEMEEQAKRKPGRPRKEPPSPGEPPKLRPLSEALNRPAAPVDVQDILNLSAPAYYSLLRSQPGLFSDDQTVLQQLHAYIKRLRDTASGRLAGIQMQKLVRPTDEDAEVQSIDENAPNITEERAKLVRAQREREVFKLNVLRGEYAPIGLLTETLALASAAVVSAIEQTQNRLSVECAGLPSDAIATVQGVLADARNRWVDATKELVNPAAEQGDDAGEE